MRFFSREWLAAEDDSDTARVVAEYQKFLASLSGAIGGRIRNFSQRHSLHDGLLDRLEVDSRTLSVIFDVVCGDEQRGYEAIGLQYRGARVVGLRADEFSSALKRGSSELLYDEFDIVGDHAPTPTYVHRFLLWPESCGEFAIEFTDFDAAATPLPARSYQNLGEVFTHRR